MGRLGRLRPLKGQVFDTARRVYLLRGLERCPEHRRLPLPIARLTHIAAKGILDGGNSRHAHGSGQVGYV